MVGTSLITMMQWSGLVLLLIVAITTAQDDGDGGRGGRLIDIE